MLCDCYSYFQSKALNQPSVFVSQVIFVICNIIIFSTSNFIQFILQYSSSRLYHFVLFENDDEIMMTSNMWNNVISFIIILYRIAFFSIAKQYSVSYHLSHNNITPQGPFTFTHKRDNVLYTHTKMQRVMFARRIVLTGSKLFVDITIFKGDKIVFVWIVCWKKLQ